MTVGKRKLGGRRAGAGRPALAPGEARSEVIRIRAAPAVLTAARELADREGISISDFGLAAIELAIARGSTR